MLWLENKEINNIKVRQECSVKRKNHKQKFFFFIWILLTESIKPKSLATYSLNRSKVLLTDALVPTANSITSPGLADSFFSKRSCSVFPKLDTKAGIPSRPPVQEHYIISIMTRSAPTCNACIVFKMCIYYHHLRPLRRAIPLLQI